MRAAGLFSGIGGLELGLARAGIRTELLCEWWAPARRTLERHFAAELSGDIRALDALPPVEVVTAGFPCTDLSQAGRTAGLDGEASGLVREVFRLVEATPPRWLLLENVPNLLSLNRGAAIREITDWLTGHGWRWAYRTVDSQHFGVRQRRRRVFLLASRQDDPREVLFADDTATPPQSEPHDAYGFSWTEGNRGLGWGEGVTPTLKGGSTIGIASPPAVWRPGRMPGAAIVRPNITAGESLQGFPAGWTDHVDRAGERWKLVGNAVTVPVAEWIGGRLIEPGMPVDVARRPVDLRARRPLAAASTGDARVEEWMVSERPVAASGVTLADLLDHHGAESLSHGAAAGFHRRLTASRLRRREDFESDLVDHVARTAVSG